MDSYLKKDKLDWTRLPCKSNLNTKRTNKYGSAPQKIRQFVKARAGRSTGSSGYRGLWPKATRRRRKKFLIILRAAS